MSLKQKESKRSLVYRGWHRVQEAWAGERNAVSSAIITLLLLACAMSVAALFAGTNLFGFPHYENDEGTYMGSAWAMFTQGKLSYYTYTYDHPVLGWMILGLWSKLAGGFEAFGNAVNTGRVFMVIVCVASTGLIFEILRRSTGRVLVALSAALLFAVSPLGVSLHRQVWIDNIATMWLLASVLAVVAARGRLGHFVVSAVFFGFAFWSKEVFVVFLPGMLYLVFAHAHPVHRRFALALWSVLAICIISVFGLLATLKDELLPPGVLWSSPEPHVSVFETLLYQARRGGSGGLLNPNGQFWTFFDQWRYNDPLLVIGGVSSAIVGLFMWRKNRMLFGVSLLTIVFLLFLGRGGVVLYYYVIPLVALFALNIGLLTTQIVNAGVRIRIPPVVLGGLLAVASLALGIHGVQANKENFTEDSTASQKEAARWISTNLSETSTIISDAYLWTDLRSPEFTGGKVFKRAHYYFPALSDDKIRKGQLKDDWRNIDYLAISPTTQADIKRNFVPLMPEAAKNSDPVTTFRSGDWRVEILRVRKLNTVTATTDPILNRSWASYKSRFVDDGQVTNPDSGTPTTSGYQATTMQRAVYMNDRAAFDQTWSWTRKNLQRPDGLLGSRYGSTTGGTDSAADTDAALGLLMASQRWNEPAYASEARKIMDGIWKEETVPTKLGRVVASNSNATGQTNGLVGINTGALSPHAYRIFAEADRSRRWESLTESSYSILSDIADTPGLGSKAGLYPDSVVLDADSGTIRPGPRERATTGDNDLAQRISLDYLWFRDARAKKVLEVLNRPSQEISKKDILFSGYNLDGSVYDDSESVTAYASAVPSLLLRGEGKLANKVYASEILGSFHAGGDTAGRAYWGGDPNDLDAQNAAWFTTAFMDGSLGNVWKGEKTVRWGDLEAPEDPSKK